MYFELSEIKFAKHGKSALAVARTSLTQKQMSPNGPEASVRCVATIRPTTSKRIFAIGNVT
jgi:hypothetical protein